MAGRIINMAVLPGEPTDGTGRVCIHLFVPDPDGLHTEPHVLYPVIGEDGLPSKKLEARSTRGRLACNPRKTIAPVIKGNVVIITSRTDDPRAVTCPRCCATDEFTRAMELARAAEAAQ